MKVESGGRGIRCRGFQTHRTKEVEMNTHGEGIATTKGLGGLTDQLSRFWWLFILTGIIALAAGIVAISYPGKTLLVLALIFGIYLLLWGVLHIVIALSARDEATESVLMLLIGVGALIAGLIIVSHPDRSIVVLTLVIGIYLVFVGVLEFITALGEQSITNPNLLRGLVSVAAGVLILSWPGPSLLILALVIGIAFIVRGIIDIFSGIRLVRLRRS